MKKFMSLFLTMAIGVGVLAGCGGAKPEPSPSAVAVVSESAAVTEEAKPVILKTVSMYGGSDPAAGAYSELIAIYEESGINKVEDSSDTANETWKASILTDFNTGNEPDVINFFNGVDVALILDKMVDVETIRAVYPDYASDIKPAVLETMKEPDGKVYTVPVKGFFEGIYVNKTMFEENDLEIPTDWDKMEKAITTLRAKGIDPFTISLGEQPHYLIEALIMSAGGVAEHSVIPTTDPATVPESWITGLDMFKTLTDMQAFPKDAATKKNDSAIQDFIAGKAGMFIDGSWTTAAIVEGGLEDEVVMVAFPTIPNGKGTGTEIVAGFSSGFYITKKAWENPETQKAAVDFVNVMVSKQGVSMLIGNGAGAPAADITPNPELSLILRSGLEMGGKASGTDMPVDSRLEKAAWAEIWTKVSDIASGKMTAQEVIDKAIPQNKQ